MRVIMRIYTRIYIYAHTHVFIHVTCAFFGQHISEPYCIYRMARDGLVELSKLDLNPPHRPLPGFIPFIPFSAKSKTDKFSKITTFVEVLRNSFPMNGHTLGFCP